MNYMGSKNRVFKHLVPFILEGRSDDQLYVEPFVGGCNAIDKVTGERWGNDSHFYLIEMWKALQKGWVPPTEVSRERYYAVKANPEKYESAYVAFVGFLMSFGCKWWGGYATNRRGDDYAKQGCNNLCKQLPQLERVRFTNLSYLDLEIPKGATVYRDPPYQGTTKYKDGFDHDQFWEWARFMSRHCRVFVSEYNAPDDFECLYEHQLPCTMDKISNSGVVKVEKLFKLR